MRLLHLSDIHFGSGHHAFSNRGNTAPCALANILAKIPASERPSLVVISGDIGWSGVKADYDEALVFCRELRQQLNVPLLIVPGNHDVDRTPGGSNDRRQDAFIAFLREFYGDDLERFYPFLNSTAAALEHREKIIAIYRNDDAQIFIVGINSASRINDWEHCGECHRRRAKEPDEPCLKCGLLKPLDTSQTTVLVSHVVADHIQAECAKLPDVQRWFKGFVLHHNMFPFDEPARDGHIELARPRRQPDGDMTVNSAAIQDWLARTGFHLVLHGHKHQTNGRQDALFRRDDQSGGRRIVVLGAGSTGVVSSDRGSEPLSYFSISTERLSDQRFQIIAKAMKIHTSTLAPYVVPDFGEFTCEVGPEIPSPPHLFYAERMIDCHAAIARATKGKGKVRRNFCSIVDIDAEVKFQFPPTTERAGKTVNPDLIAASFLALHPEFNREMDGWGESQDVGKRLLSLRPRFLFQHGPRMFGAVKNRPTTPGDEATHQSPMHDALDELEQRPHTSHAFVGVFHPAIDVSGKMGPPPALAGVQFHVDQDAKRLELTFTFRKIDLSFWWVVNMYEAIKLWRWAHRKLQKECRCTSGRITFFATLAEWKDEDTAAFSVDIDNMELEKIVEMALAADSGNVDELLRKLHDKKEQTNANNIDSHGLERLADVVLGIIRSRVSDTKGLWTDGLRTNLCRTLDFLRNAEANARKRKEDAAKADLEGAWGELRSVEEVLSKNRRL